MQRLGIIGGGQLARMMAQAASSLGIMTTVLDPNADACAGQVATLIRADYNDANALASLAAQCDVLTFDFENVSADCLQELASRYRVCPGVEALTIAQDRLLEKNLCRELNINVADFYAIDSRPDLLAALEQTGYPAILKTRRFGYDGKGQYVLRQPEDLEHAWQKLAGHALILEQFVPFDWECSLIGVRSSDGNTRFYPLTRNHHDQGILSFSHAPVMNLPSTMQIAAQAYLQRILERFDYVGVLTMELFVVGEQLLVNEIAPRVHNSGHWTIEGAVCSQFENHVRACCDLPLGSTNAVGESLMLNWIGEVPEAHQFLMVDGLHWHDYGKASRKGRKVGHATLHSVNRDMLDQSLEDIANSLGNRGVVDFMAKRV